MLPNRARLHLCGFSDPDYVAQRLGWAKKEVWGMDRHVTLDYICSQVIIEQVPEHCVATSEWEACNLNLETCRQDLIDIENTFTLTFKPGFYTLHGIVLFFSVDFEHFDNPISLWTSPDEEPTHWGQALLLFKNPLDRACRLEEPIKGKIRLSTSTATSDAAGPQGLSRAAAGKSQPQSGQKRSLTVDIEIENNIHGNQAPPTVEGATGRQGIKQSFTLA